MVNFSRIDTKFSLDSKSHSTIEVISNLITKHQKLVEDQKTASDSRKSEIKSELTKIEETCKSLVNKDPELTNFTDKNLKSEIYRLAANYYFFASSETIETTKTAMKYFKMAVQQDPKNIKALYNLAKSSMNLLKVAQEEKINLRKECIDNLELAVRHLKDNKDAAVRELGNDNYNKTISFYNDFIDKALGKDGVANKVISAWEKYNGKELQPEERNAAKEYIANILKKFKESANESYAKTIVDVPSGLNSKEALNINDFIFNICDAKRGPLFSNDPSTKGALVFNVEKWNKLQELKSNGISPTICKLVLESKPVDRSGSLDEQFDQWESLLDSAVKVGKELLLNNRSSNEQFKTDKKAYLDYATKLYNDYNKLKNSTENAEKQFKDLKKIIDDLEKSS